MSKKLLFLLPIAMLALTGCGKDDKKSEEPEKEVPASLVFNLDAVGEFEIAGSTYAANDFTFSIGDYEFGCKGGTFGRSAHRDGEMNWFNDNKVMQLKANDSGETVKLNTEYPAKKIVFDVVSTYDTQAEAYYPVVKAGEEATSLDVTGVSCDKSGTVNGVKIEGAKQGNKKDGDVVVGYDVYRYSYEYTLPEGTKFISFGAGSGALNFISATISK